MSIPKGTTIMNNTTETKQTSTEFFNTNWSECWKEAKETLGRHSTYDELSTKQYNLYASRYSNYFQTPFGE